MLRFRICIVWFSEGVSQQYLVSVVLTLSLWAGDDTQAPGHTHSHTQSPWTPVTSSRREGILSMCRVSVCLYYVH